MRLAPKTLSDFPGFPVSTENSVSPTKYKQVVKPFEKACNEWLFVTGTQLHYLKSFPEFHTCRFHDWANCRNAGRQIGSAAISTSSVNLPRAFFTDGHMCHCAHQTVHDRCVKRCHIQALDERSCCRTCIYQDLCWTPEDLEGLPCESRH